MKWTIGHRFSHPQGHRVRENRKNIGSLGERLYFGPNYGALGEHNDVIFGLSVRAVLVPSCISNFKGRLCTELLFLQFLFFK